MTITAEAYTCYQFDSWTVNGENAGNSNPLSLYVYKNMSITGNFSKSGDTPLIYKLKNQKNREMINYGCYPDLVTVEPNKSCYRYGDEMTLTAHNQSCGSGGYNASYTFLRWEDKNGNEIGTDKSLIIKDWNTDKAKEEYVARYDVYPVP